MVCPALKTHHAEGRLCQKPPDTWLSVRVLGWLTSLPAAASLSLQALAAFLACVHVDKYAASVGKYAVCVMHEHTQAVALKPPPHTCGGT
eukprot:87200-Pelagomonas_calceolata.AAC.3